MNQQTKPSAGALRAGFALIRDASTGKLRNMSDLELMAMPISHKIARIIDRETGLAELLAAAKMAESSFSSLEACNLWMERDHQRLNQLRQAIAKAEAK